MMLVLMVGCSGPSNKDTCIPARTTDDELALDGSEMAKAEDIDQKLRDAQIITNIVNKIKESVMGNSPIPFVGGGGAQNMFNGIVSSPMIQNGIIGAFILYVMIFGVMIIGGMINVTLNELIIRMIKVAFIGIFAFSWSEFYPFIGQASLTFTDEMLTYFLNAFSFKFKIGGVGVSITESVFAKLDYFVARIFGVKMMALLSALFLAGGSTGPIYALLILMSVFFTFKAIITVVLVYCFSLFARALLFAVAPIFLTCMLFKPTQTLFDSWLRQLVNYSLQPVLVGAFLGVFLGIMEPFFQEFLKYHFCWMPIDSTREQYSWVFVDPATKNKIDFGANSQPAIEIQRILLFVGFAYIFYSGVKLGQNVAAGLSGTVAGDLSAAARGLGGLSNYVGSKNSTIGAMLKQL